MRMRLGWQRRLMAIIGLFFLLFLLGELVLRIINYSYHPLRIKLMVQKHRTDWRYTHAFKDKHFVYDPHTIWTPKKNFSVFNKYGYSGDDLSIEKSKNKIRMVTLGDSNMLGVIAEKNANWPGYLVKKDSRFELLNAGVYGYSSYQGLVRLQDAMRFSPDMVLISFGANDALLVAMSDVDFIRDKVIRRFKIDLFLYQFRIGQLILKCLDSFVMKVGKAAVPRVSLGEYEANINAMIKRVHETKAKVVLLTRPFLYSCPEGKMWKDRAAPYNAVVRKIANTQKVKLIDLFSYFDNKRSFFQDGSHFNDKGHKLAADIVYKEIADFVES